MSFSVLALLYCDGGYSDACARPDPYQVEGVKTAHELRLLAKKDGWGIARDRRDGTKSDLCPECKKFLADYKARATGETVEEGQG